MQIIGRSSGPLQNAISTGLDSVAEGIAQTTQSQGIAALDNAVNSFSIADSNPQIFLSAQPQVSAAAEFPDPASFLKSEGISNDVLSSLNNPQFQPAPELNSFSSDLSGITNNLPVDQAQTLMDMQSTVGQMTDLQKNADLQFQLSRLGTYPQQQPILKDPIGPISQGIGDVIQGRESGSAESTESAGDGMPDLDSLGLSGKGKTILDGESHIARIGDFDYEDSGDGGTFKAKGATDFLFARGRIYGDTNADDGSVGVNAGIEGEEGVASSHYQINYDSPSVHIGDQEISSKTQVNADALVGSKGNAEVDLSLGKNTHVDIGGGAFSGASASLSGSESVGDLGSASGSISGWTGVGAEAGIKAGIDDGKLSWDLHAGLALGIGGEYDIGFSVDLPKIGETLVNAGDEALNKLGDVGSAIGGVAQDAADAAKQAAEDATKAAIDTAKKAIGFIGGSDAANAVDDATQAAQDAVKAAIDAAKKALGWAGDAASDAADAAGDVVDDIVDAGSDAVDAGGDLIDDVFDW